MSSGWLDKAVIEIEADATSRRWRLDKRRVRSVFFRLAEIGWLWPHFPRQTALDVAFGYLDPAQALTLFEVADLRLLAKRCAVTEYLLDPGTPFCTMSELGLELGSLATAFSNGDSELARSGYLTRGAKLLWLEQHLAPVNATKLPASVSGVLSPPWRNEWRPAEGYSYLWLSEAPHDIGWRGNILSFPQYAWHKNGPLGDDENPLTLCSYEDAPYVNGLPEEVAARLEAERSPVVDIKARMLRFLAEAAGAGDPDGVWSGALRLLTESLMSEQMDFYLACDALYRRLELGSALNFVYGRAPLPGPAGSMSDLLTVVGQVEEEMRVGTFHAPKTMLREFFDDEITSPYFRYAGRSQQHLMDQVIDEFLRRDAVRQDYWIRYNERVTAALASEFDEVVTIQSRVRQKHVSTFEPFVQSFADWQAMHLRSTDSLAALGGTSPTSYVKAQIARSLTPEEHEEFQRYQFKSRLPIEITGEVLPRSSNRLLVDASEVVLGDTPFALFLRLVIELFSTENRGGFVFKGHPISCGGLVSEGYLNADGIDQGISRLRREFATALKGRDPRRFIEVQQRRVRLSTHRKLIRYDRERLIHHPDATVAAIARGLPERDSFSSQDGYLAPGREPH